MTDLNTLVGRLRVFDLIENEARVYVALALKGPLRPSEIAGASGVARAEVHRHLRELEKRGFCVVVGEKGKKYSAINPSEALSSIVEQEEHLRDQMRRRKEKLVSEWSSSRHSITALGAEPERLQVIRDLGIALEKGMNMALSSRKACRVVLHRVTIEENISPEIRQIIESHSLMEELGRKSEVQVLLLFVSSSPDMRSLRDLFGRAKTPPNISVKWATSPILEVLPDVIIADEDAMLIHTFRNHLEKNKEMSSRDSKAVVTNVLAMIRSFVVMFDEAWKGAS
jgi:sugar-specific transcriptional regulator TrmB